MPRGVSAQRDVSAQRGVRGERGVSAQRGCECTLSMRSSSSSRSIMLKAFVIRKNLFSMLTRSGASQAEWSPYCSETCCPCQLSWPCITFRKVGMRTAIPAMGATAVS